MTKIDCVKLLLFYAKIIKMAKKLQYIYKSKLSGLET